MVRRNTSKSFICDFDLTMTLEDFLTKKPAVKRKLVECLNQPDNYNKLMDAAIDKRIFASNIKLKMSRFSNTGVALINEFQSRCFTMELFCECIKGWNLPDLFKILGVIETMQVISQSGPLVYCRFGKEVTLSYIVEGFPKPTFQWYFNGELIKDASQDTITLLNFSENFAGKYYCIAEQISTSLPSSKLTSNIIECVLLEDLPSFEQDLPSELSCHEYEEITLRIIANDGFNGQCDWFYMKQKPNSDEECCNEKLKINPISSNCLVFKNVTAQRMGYYKCTLTNSAGETHSNYCHLRILPPLLRPTAKLALLFGNGNYTNFSPLRTPTEDVELLSYHLQRLGFSVFSYTDLSNTEAEYKLIQFLANVPQKSFVFVYFSGHGFEYCNNKFFMPVDCPPSSSYSTGKDCLSYEKVVQNMMRAKPLLLISVLDMCLGGPDEKENPQIFTENLKHYGYKKPAHSCFIEACATSDYQLSFESKTEKNSLYCRCLCQHLMKDLPIDDIFNAAHADFVNHVKKRRQSPQFKYVYGEQECKRFRLNMKISKK